MAQRLELPLWSAAPRALSPNRKSLPPHLVTKQSKSASIHEKSPANQPDFFCLESLWPTSTLALNIRPTRMERTCPERSRMGPRPRVKSREAREDCHP